MHDDFAPGEDIPAHGTTDNHSVCLYLRFHLRPWINYKRVIGENLSFEVAADAHRAFKSQLAVETGSLIEKCRNSAVIRLWEPGTAEPFYFRHEPLSLSTMELSCSSEKK